MKRQGWAAVGFLTPNLVGFLIFTLGPVVAAAGLSFYRYQLASGQAPNFIGLANFAELVGFDRVDGEWKAHDPYFWQYLGNTLFLMLNIPFSMAGALILAVMLNKKLKGASPSAPCFSSRICATAWPSSWYGRWSSLSSQTSASSTG